MAEMSPEQMALHVFAEEYDIDLSSAESFDEELDCVREFVKDHDSWDMNTEVEFNVTAELDFGLTLESVTWGDWWEDAAQDIQMSVADHGFDSQSEVKGMEIEEVWDF